MVAFEEGAKRVQQVLLVSPPEDQDSPNLTVHSPVTI